MLSAHPYLALHPAECSESAPLLYGTTIWQVSTYWLTAIGSIVYVVKHKIQGRTNKKKVIAVDYSATEEENEEGGEGDEEEFGREEDEEKRDPAPERA